MSDGEVEMITDVKKEKESAGNGAAPDAACRFGKCVACGAGHSPDTCPQLLPCLHSLCKVCLQPGAQEDVRVCPVCNGKYTLVEVKNDPFFRGLTYNSGDQVQSKCGGCEDATVSGWCVECGEALCAACVLAHRRVRLTREHKVLPQQLSKGCVPITFCLIHKQEPMKLFCLSCDQLTCRDCQLTYHRNHRFQFVSEVMADLKQDVRKLMEKVQCQKSHVKKSLLDLDGRLSDLTVLQYKVRMGLRDAVLSLRNVLVARALQLVEEMKGYCGREMDSIFKRQEVLRKLKEHQEHVLAFAERALHVDDHFTLLTCKKEIQQQMQNLLSCSTQPPTFMIEMELQFEQELHKIIKNYGRILVKNVPFKPSDHPFPSKHPEPAFEPLPMSEPLPVSEPHPAPIPMLPKHSPDTTKPCSVQPDLHLSPLAHQSTERSHVPVTTTWTPPIVVGPDSLPSVVSPLVSCPPSVIQHHSWTHPAHMPGPAPLPGPHPAPVPGHASGPHPALVPGHASGPHPAHVPGPAPVPSHASGPHPAHVPGPHPAPVFGPAPVPSHASGPHPAHVPSPAPVPGHASGPHPAHVPSPAPVPGHASGPHPAPVSGPAPVPSHASGPHPAHVPGPHPAPVFGPAPVPSHASGPHPAHVPGPTPVPGPHPAPVSGHTPVPSHASGPHPAHVPGHAPVPGPHPAHVPGHASGPHPAPVPGPASGPHPAPVPGPASGPHPAPVPGPASGPHPAPVPGPASGLHPASEPVPPKQSPDTPKPCSVQPDLSPLAHQSTNVPVTTTWTPPIVVGQDSLPSVVSPFRLVSCPPSVIQSHSWTKKPIVSLCSVQLDTPKVTGKSAAQCVVRPTSSLMMTPGTLPIPLLLTSVVNVMVPVASQRVGLVRNVKSNLEKEKTLHSAAKQPKYQVTRTFSQITTSQSLGSANTPAICVGSAQPFKLPPGASCSVLSVKALADSPCERLPSAVCSPEAKRVLKASENEPTSTVMEVDPPLFTEDSVIEGTASSQPFSAGERLATRVIAPMRTDITTVTVVTANNNVGIGNAVIAATVTGADGETAVLIDHPTIMTAGSRNKIVVSQEVTTDSGKRATVTLIDLPVANSTAVASATEQASDMSTVGVNMPVDGGTTEANSSAVLTDPVITTHQHLSQANGQIQIAASACGQISSPRGKCKPSQNSTKSSEPSAWPSSFREAPERRTVTSPQADSLSPELGQQKMSEGFTNSKNTKLGSPPSSTQFELEDESFRCPLEEYDDSEETNLDSGRTHAYSEPVDRCLLPCVSLFRIPIPRPPPGHPLPSFYVVPGTKKNEILLQIMEERGQFSVSPDSATVSTCLRAPPPPPVNDRVQFCAVCRLLGATVVCSVCSCSFHRNCHIPSVHFEASSGGGWQCMLCRDFPDVGDQFCSSVDGHPSLSLLEQRKCEHVLLVLLCETYSSSLYQPAKSRSHSSRSVSIMRIQGRLSRDLKPPYRTPSQFVSDVRLLFDILKSSKDSSKIAKLQSCFERAVRKVFGKSICDSPTSASPKEPEARKGVETASPKHSETLKRMRAFLGKNPCEPPTKRHKD